MTVNSVVRACPEISAKCVATYHSQAAGAEAESRGLYEVMTATLADTSRAFGEPLPNGLTLVGPST